MHSIFSFRVCIANSRFSGFRYRFIPSLRFGTGFASPYNPCHGLKLKNSKLKQLHYHLAVRLGQGLFLKLLEIIHNHKSDEMYKCFQYNEAMFIFSNDILKCLKKVTALYFFSTLLRLYNFVYFTSLSFSYS